MKSIIFIVVCYLFCIPSGIAAPNFVVFDTSLASSVKYSDFIESLPQKTRVVLGEYHYSDKIQKAQAKIIKDMVNAHQLSSNFSIAWEFLNYTEYDQIQDTISDYKKGFLNDLELLGMLFPQPSNPAANKSYLPILRVAKSLDGQFFGVNIARSIKRQIIKHGIDSIALELIPPNHTLGSSDYYDRFYKFMQGGMGGHMTEEMIKKYYLAQCFTDSVMSYYMDTLALYDLSFLIVGSFHSDYFGGVTDKLRQLSPTPLINLKFVDTETMSEEEIELLKSPSQEYGIIADYIILINP